MSIPLCVCVCVCMYKGEKQGYIYRSREWNILPLETHEGIRENNATSSNLSFRLIALSFSFQHTDGTLWVSQRNYRIFTMCTSHLPVSEFSVVDWLSRIMETETGTFNKMENMKIWVVLPQTSTKWSWTGYWCFIQIDSDIFSVCQREVVLSSIGYQKCLRSIKNTNIWSNLIKIMTFFP